MMSALQRYGCKRLTELILRNVHSGAFAKTLTG